MGAFQQCNVGFCCDNDSHGRIDSFRSVENAENNAAQFAARACARASGAIGNLIDRVALGYVRDFIAFDFMNFPVFNFADSCITVGAVLLIVSVLFTKSGRAYFAALDEKKQKPEKTDGEKNAGCAAGNGGEAGAEPDVKQAESK